MFRASPAGAEVPACALTLACVSVFFLCQKEKSENQRQSATLPS